MKSVCCKLSVSSVPNGTNTRVYFQPEEGAKKVPFQSLRKVSFQKGHGSLSLFIDSGSRMAELEMFLGKKMYITVESDILVSPEDPESLQRVRLTKKAVRFDDHLVWTGSHDDATFEVNLDFSIISIEELNQKDDEEN